jgi:hypothetical protein
MITTKRKRGVLYRTITPIVFMKETSLGISMIAKEKRESVKITRENAHLFFSKYKDIFFIQFPHL